MLDFDKMIYLSNEDEETEKIIIVEVAEFGKLTIGKHVFINRFGGAVTFDDYISHDKTTDGWRTIFEDWKRKGYFN